MSILIVISAFLTQQNGAIHIASAPKPAVVSWYNRGLHTANGERFDPRGFTAAHKTLPIGTKVWIFNKQTNKSAIVRINDRGPFPRGRDIDVTEAVAEYLGVKEQGVSTLVHQVVPSDVPNIPVLQIGDTLNEFHANASASAKPEARSSQKPAAGRSHKKVAAAISLPPLKFPIVPPL